jgi:short subunit dehydrogenase
LVEQIKNSQLQKRIGKEKRPEVGVITGASAGIGRATARRFARDGAQIGLLARGMEGLEGARRDVETLGGQALPVPTDVAVPEQVESKSSSTQENSPVLKIRGVGYDRLAHICWLRCGMHSCRPEFISVYWI